ncbi:RdRP-domain-containing protein [Rickenella mellea]|uniref:RNA-dependent RNA polymerase n=1 Tax=Rickenella mellea TaxID=50990 RepID=A0A4Y7PUQ5_9AGAM|nr:RdRP-domain-containing protein [Rickenella mellea]
MQIYMRSVAFSATEEDVVVALAKNIHRPPFPLEPPTNFHVHLFPKNRSTAHRGMGILTFASEETAYIFLRAFGAMGIAVKGRAILFTVSRNQDKALIARVAGTNWIDPDVLRERREKMRQGSQPIQIASFAFGRYCRDGVFSAELEVDNEDAKVVCDMELRQLRIYFRGWNLNLPQSRRSRYSTQFLVLLRWVRLTSVNSLAFSWTSTRRPFSNIRLNPPLPDRISSLDSSARLTTVWRGLCLTFRDESDLETFEARWRRIGAPHPLRHEFIFDRRTLYSEENLAKLTQYMATLPFDLAFEVDKATHSGIMEPLEIVQTLRESTANLLHQNPKDAAAIFRYFTNNFTMPSLRSQLDRPGKPSRRRRGRKEDKKDYTLPELLSNARNAYLAELARPRSRLSAPTSQAVTQTYHLVVTPSMQILEGPLPDQTNSVLHQFQNPHSFLQVSFQDEQRCKPRREYNLSIDKLLDSRFKPFLLNGVHIAGRFFEFLGYSMSGLKEYKFLFVTAFEFEDKGWNASKIRDRLGDFSNLSSRPALLGARWAQAFSTSDPTVTLAAETIKRDDDIACGGSVFTDGVSRISPSLARETWRHMQLLRRRFTHVPAPPSAFQFRLGGAKGMLVQDPELKEDGSVLFLRPSQVKFESESRTLHITGTSLRPIPCFLNRPLIILLEHHGVPDETFINLQDLAIRTVQRARDSFSHSFTLFSQHGLGGSFRLPSLFNSIQQELNLDLGDDEDGLHHHLINTSITYGMTHVLRGLKHRARIPIPGCYTLIGVADEWDCLNEGEIYATVVDERNNVTFGIKGDVLITRSPQIHPGDVQLVKAVRRDQLKHLRNVVVFSCRGKRSLPSCLGGGDLDGDIYNLITDKRLFPKEDADFSPGSYIGLPYKTIEGRDCTVADVVDFVVDYMRSDLVGHISILHMRIADLDPNGPACGSCLALAGLNSHAVDFPKRGTRVEFKNLPQPPGREKPDYLSGEGTDPTTSNAYYPSKRILGILFRRVPFVEAPLAPMNSDLTDGQKIEYSLQYEVLRGLSFDEDSFFPSETLLEEMGHLLEAYSEQLFTIAKTHTISKRADDHLTEAELVSGTIQAKWADHKKRDNAVTAMNLQTQELTTAIRRELQGYGNQANGEEFDEDDDDEWRWHYVEEDGVQQLANENKKFSRSWAAWVVAEEAVREGDLEPPFGAQSFGLIALGTMLELIKTRRAPNTKIWEI